MTLIEEFNKLMQVHWQFLNADWPIIIESKYHCTEVKSIQSIEYVKDIVFQKIGVIPVFSFLLQLFSIHDYSGPYRNVEKGLLLLYHILKGYSIINMNRFIPKSSFYELYKEFYIKQHSILDKKVTSMLEHMFSNIKIRLYSAMKSNPPLFKHVTLNLDGHDTRAVYPNVDKTSLYSYKLKKSGFRTQVCTDVNNMVFL